MSQNQASGAKANEYGRECGAKIAAALGATKKRAGSNECILNGETIWIKCANPKTNKVGVYSHVFDRIAAVLGAFKTDDGQYNVFRLSTEQFLKNMVERDYERGKMGQVTRSVFERDGLKVGALKLD